LLIRLVLDVISMWLTCDHSLLLQQKFGIKTAGLEDKVTACQMLVIYARDLKEGFVEYAEPVSSCGCRINYNCLVLYHR